jgi:hypothetical protein
MFTTGSFPNELWFTLSRIIRLSIVTANTAAVAQAFTTITFSGIIGAVWTVAVDGQIHVLGKQWHPR